MKPHVQFTNLNCSQVQQYNDAAMTIIVPVDETERRKAYFASIIESQGKCKSKTLPH